MNTNLIGIYSSIRLPMRRTNKYTDLQERFLLAYLWLVNLQTQPHRTFEQPCCIMRLNQYQQEFFVYISYIDCCSCVQNPTRRSRPRTNAVHKILWWVGTKLTNLMPGRLRIGQSTTHHEKCSQRLKNRNRNSCRKPFVHIELWQSHHTRSWSVRTVYRTWYQWTARRLLHGWIALSQTNTQYKKLIAKTLLPIQRPQRQNSRRSGQIIEKFTRALHHTLWVPPKTSTWHKA